MKLFSYIAFIFIFSSFANAEIHSSFCSGPRLLCEAQSEVNMKNPATMYRSFVLCKHANGRTTLVQETGNTSASAVLPEVLVKMVRTKQPEKLGLDKEFTSLVFLENKTEPTFALSRDLSKAVVLFYAGQVFASTFSCHR